jgi:hypothetical protein
MSTTNANKATTNESKVRLIALFVFLLSVVYLVTSTIIIPIVLVLDFFLRSFNMGAFSPFGILSDWLIICFKFPAKPVYLPPKRFAARIGLLFSIAILILHLLSDSELAIVAVAGTLTFFAALESFFSICAGCYVYSFLVQLKIISY